MSAPRPLDPRPNRPLPQPVADGEEYQLDAEAAPGPRPIAPHVARAAREAAPRSATDAARQPARQVRRAPPVGTQPAKSPADSAPTSNRQGPRWLAMLITGPVIARWVVLSAVLAVVAWFGIQGWTMNSGGMGAIAQVCFFALAVMLGTLWTMAAAALWMAIVTESSEGHNRLHNPPGAMFFDWLGETAYAAMSLAAAALPGWLAWQFLPEDFAWRTAAAVAASLMVHPLALLSSLEQDSPFGVVSLTVATSLLRCPAAWGAAWLQIGLLAATVSWLLSTPAFSPLWMASLLVVASSLLYCRCVGLLGWRLAEALAVWEFESDEADGSK